LSVNDDLKNRVTCSVLLKKLAPDRVADFIRAELDKAALAHSTFSDDALSLIVRSSEGGLRKTRNLCLSSLLEAVRDRTKVVELKRSSRSTASYSSPTGAKAQRGRPSALICDQHHISHGQRRRGAIVRRGGVPHFAAISAPKIYDTVGPELRWHCGNLCESLRRQFCQPLRCQFGR
jgi:hypothetical protein